MSRNEEYFKEYYLKNKERLKKKYEDNKEEIIKKVKNRYDPKTKSEYDKKYRLENSDKIKKYNKEYYENNKEDLYEKQKVYVSKNKDKISEYLKEYNEDPIVIIKRQNRVKNKYDNDECFKFSTLFRNNLNFHLKKSGFTKSKTSEEVLGCSFEDFKLYLELQFETWMTWENHGKYNGEMNYGWDIDHIIPLNSASSEEEIYKLCHYINFQPLCSYTNRHIKRHLVIDNECLFCGSEIINRKYCNNKCKFKYYYEQAKK